MGSSESFGGLWKKNLYNSLQKGGRRATFAQHQVNCLGRSGCDGLFVPSARSCCCNVMSHVQAGHVGLETCTAPAMEPTRRPWAPRSSTRASRAARASSSCATPADPSTVSGEARWWSRPPTSAPRAPMVDGATPPRSTLTSHNPSLRRSRRRSEASSPSTTGG